MNQHQILRLCAALCYTLFFLSAVAFGQNFSLRPDQLQEGDGKTRNITLLSDVNSNATISISVWFSLEPNAQASLFIAPFTVQDNRNGDRSPREGHINVVLPRAFDRIGIYTVELVTEGTRAVRQVTYGKDERGFFQRFFDSLVGGAGPERGGETDSGPATRVRQLAERGQQRATRIWLSPMPEPGEQIEGDAIKPKVESAIMPAWSPNGGHLACSKWTGKEWVIAVYAFKPGGELSELWQWKRTPTGANDLTPVWSPNALSIAFLRISAENKGDIWVLRLDNNLRPQNEVQLTNSANVEELLGWDKARGLSFVLRKKVGTDTSIQETWAGQVGSGKELKIEQQHPLSPGHALVRGYIPARQSVVYEVANESTPISVLTELELGCKKTELLYGNNCFYKWPTVSPDGKWLATDSDCPPGR